MMMPQNRYPLKADWGGMSQTTHLPVHHIHPWRVMVYDGGDVTMCFLSIWALFHALVVFAWNPNPSKSVVKSGVIDKKIIVFFHKLF